MKSCPSPFLMNCAAFTAWAIPYQITLYLALGFSPSLFASIAAIVAGSGAGFFGLFVREGTSDVIQVHPILTILYTSLVSGILLSLFSFTSSPFLSSRKFSIYEAISLPLRLFAPFSDFSGSPPLPAPALLFQWYCVYFSPSEQNPSAGSDSQLSVP